MTLKYKVYINNEAKFVTENWLEFCSEYKLIEAAGGLVMNSQNKMLMILRNSKWDLPKGKLEEGESIQECAIREVEEETGVQDLIIKSKLIDTYHTYKINKINILKKTYWFMMTTDFRENFSPQKSEGIYKVEWCEKKNVIIRLENSYQSLKDVINSSEI